MKAFKGCTNTECAAYKKIHYKESDQYCLKCGKTLSFVCAECWKPMENGSKRYCISCAAGKDQRKEDTMKVVKNVGAGVVAVAVAIPNLIKNSDTVLKDGKKVLDSVKEVVAMIKK